MARTTTYPSDIENNKILQTTEVEAKIQLKCAWLIKKSWNFIGINVVKISPPVLL